MELPYICHCRARLRSGHAATSALKQEYHSHDVSIVLRKMYGITARFLGEEDASANESPNVIPSASSSAFVSHRAIYNLSKITY